MPCYSHQRDYTPTARELEARLVDRLVPYLCILTGLPRPRQITPAPGEGLVDSNLDQNTRFLCETMKSLPEGFQDRPPWTTNTMKRTMLLEWYRKHRDADEASRQPASL